ncbi:MAG: helix-turn-helix domain-containing protein [Coriobacteriales bacterium]|jgi:HTH-type transcriptional regulator/antitoxin HipB|nr:helix-turn-helix domain-containing protein [Coriobacteriales bacterium]
MNVDIAERLAERRRERGLSQEALAEKLGVTRQAVSKWERSESSPDTDNLIALAELYKVSLDELLYVDAKIKDDVAFESQDRAVRPSPDSTGTADEPTDSASGNPTTASKGNAAANSGADTTADDPDTTGRVHVSFTDGIHVEEPTGDKVHINWKDGINVTDSNGEQVHVSFQDGVRVESTIPESQEWWTNYSWYDDDGTWHGKNGGWHGKHSAWLKFPFPILVTIIYLLLGFLLDAWAPALFVFLSIPIYYSLVNGIVKHKVSTIFMASYPLLATGWFLYMWLVLGQPHPAWIIFLTIPLWEWAAHSIRRWYRRKKAAEKTSV